MRFHFLASQPTGRVIEGDYEANGAAEVLEYLAKQGLRPISIKLSKEIAAVGRHGIFSSGINTTDKVFLTKYLSLMLKVGTDLLKAIDILINDLEKPATKSLLLEMKSSLEKGQPFYSTFAKYPKSFSPVFVNLIKAGEASGNLEIVLENLTISLEKEQDLNRGIKSALTYPVILLAGSFGVLVLMVTFAVPKLAAIFSSFPTEPPLFSRIVISVGLFLSQNIWYFLGGLVFIVVFSWYGGSKTVAGRKIAYQISTKIPVIKNVLKQRALERFASTLSSLMKAGLPILDAIEITADTVGSQPIKEALLRISREGVSKGLTLGDAFRREKIFPGIVVNLMSISEKAGHIEDILSTLADFYAKETENAIKIMVTLLEPMLLVVIGIIIGTIALSVIVPIYQMISQF